MSEFEHMNELRDRIEELESQLQAADDLVIALKIQAEPMSRHAIYCLAAYEQMRKLK